MSLQQTIIAIVVALIGAASGIVAERGRAARTARAKVQETSAATATVETARLTDERAKRQELEAAGRDVRSFLSHQVSDLNQRITLLEAARLNEQTRWGQLITELTTRNLDLELQHRKDMSRIQELEEEATAIDDDLKIVRARVATCQSEAIVLAARLDQCKLECARLRESKIEKRSDHHGE